MDEIWCIIGEENTHLNLLINGTSFAPLVGLIFDAEETHAPKHLSNVH